MNHSSSHLPGIAADRIGSSRLETRVLLSDDRDGQPVLFLHGNLASSTFWEETMLGLPPGFAAFAPDLRGYGLSEPSALIDATRGVADNGAILERLGSVPEKPPLLWIHGAEDAIVSDGSYSDPGYQGQSGIRSDWPGAGVFPPQPLLAQLKYAVDRYEKTGGKVRRLTLPEVGHTPHLERPMEVQVAMREHLPL